ncbi:MAG: hypothetical protein K2N23_04185 [Clostridia bacterium]|nr:hypothetical protein [Clostridia bacterium]
MKRIISVILTVVSVLCAVFAFSGCGQKFNNKLPHKVALVRIDYGDSVNKKAQLSIANETEKFNFSGVDFFNKSNSKKVKKLVGGDRLEIYYTDENYENVDHILVQKAKVLTLEVEVGEVPGDPPNARDVYSTSPNISINHTKYEVNWVIDKSGNLIALSEFRDSDKLYGTFIEEEVEEVGRVKVKLHYIHALYTYNPR